MRARLPVILFLQPLILQLFFNSLPTVVYTGQRPAPCLVASEDARDRENSIRTLIFVVDLTDWHYCKDNLAVGLLFRRLPGFGEYNLIAAQ